MTPNRRTRRGVTLVEMLVAAAMCIMGMWLLSWLYQQGLESFRLSRAQADLTAQQRMVTSVMTRDLTNPHFDNEDTKPNHGRKLSDQRLDQIIPFQDPKTGKWTVTGYTPPRFGYFRAGSFLVDGINNVAEGYDGVADSTRSTNHFLQFTTILPGGPNFQQFSCQVPANAAGTGTQWYGTAAEITYYLRKSADVTPNGSPLYDLYRQQRLVARNLDDVNAYATPVSYANPATAPNGTVDNVNEVMVLKNGQMAMLSDLTIPSGFPNSCRLPGPTFTPLGIGTPSLRFAEDKLMSNVISFEVKFTGSSGPLAQAIGLTWPRPFALNSDYPYDTLPNDGFFDTFSTQANIPGGPTGGGANWDSMINVAGPAAQFGLGGDFAMMKPIRITGTQIRLRAYEPKTRSTRQTTLILDL